MAIRIGSHISIRGGYGSAAKTAVAIGADAFQYFPKNPRSLQLKRFDRSDAARCAAFIRERGLVSIAHSPYPVNLADPSADRRAVIVRSLRNDLEIADACGSVGIVVHFGKPHGEDLLEGYRTIIQCLNETLADWTGGAKLLLENQAGESGPVGTTFEELVHIRKLTDYPEKIGFCLDTCHLFASGIWNGDNWEAVAEQGRQLDYWVHLYAVHLNDSAYPSGRRKDRHAPIGRGQIGADRFRQLLQTPELSDVPFILETPAGPDGTHRDEIRFVRMLAEGG
jgi:deoxyribonuclease-4